MDQHENKSMSNRLSAETRRNQFRQKSVSLNDSRPRLMRAMSAPIRQNPPPEARDKTSSPNNQNANKKRLRRKKIAPIEIEPFSLKLAPSHQYPNKLVTQRSFDERPSTAKALSSRAVKATKPPKPVVQPRAKSAVNGCEIVTLVSLLSPGASDSEKEDYSNATNDSSHERTIPSLRKVGKSGKICISTKLHYELSLVLFCCLGWFSLISGWRQFGWRWTRYRPTVRTAASFSRTVGSENSLESAAHCTTWIDIPQIKYNQVSCVLNDHYCSISVDSID